MVLLYPEALGRRPEPHCAFRAYCRPRDRVWWIRPAESLTGSGAGIKCLPAKSLP